jgi:hypothetical protein
MIWEICRRGASWWGFEYITTFSGDNEENYEERQWDSFVYSAIFELWMPTRQPQPLRVTGHASPSCVLRKGERQRGVLARLFKRKTRVRHVTTSDDTWRHVVTQTRRWTDSTSCFRRFVVVVVVGSGVDICCHYCLIPHFCASHKLSHLSRFIAT